MMWCRVRQAQGGTPRQCAGLLIATVLVAGCSADSDARDSAGATANGRPEASTADFVDAYEAGFQRGIADGKTSSRDDAGGQTLTDREFSTRWHALSALEVADLNAYVRSGDADAWLDRRYRALAFPSRDVVSANALLFLANWEAFTGVAATKAQAAGVRRQIETNSAPSRSRESVDEVDVRRRVYELMAATLAREGNRTRAQADSTGIAAFTATVRRDFQRMSNNDLAEFTLSDDGFQER